ncbi:hypothetical protein BDW74DRAFT_98900 [Aspergillus multicolor]|uniref:uncharacterized protein n=1 Tax=Aspergillus multicolor TaxID=41759 RepID=UPI003CCE0F44
MFQNQGTETFLPDLLSGAVGLVGAPFIGIRYVLVRFTPSANDYCTEFGGYLEPCADRRLLYTVHRSVHCEMSDAGESLSSLDMSQEYCSGLSIKLAPKLSEGGNGVRSNGVTGLFLTEPYPPDSCHPEFSS